MVDDLDNGGQAARRGAGLQQDNAADLNEAPLRTDNRCVTHLDVFGGEERDLSGEQSR